MSEYAIEMIMGEERAITIEPDRFFGSRNNTVGRFRMIAKLSAASDLLFGTDCLSKWAEEVSFRLKLSIAGMEQQKQNCSEALAQNNKRAYKTAAAELKKAETQHRKYTKYMEIIEEVKP